jgi:hypothetical protein
MRVTITHAVFQNNTAFVALDRLIDHFLDGRHLWEINDVDAIRGSTWLMGDDRVARRNVEALEKCFVANAQQPTSQTHRIAITVDVASAPPSRLSIADALTSLRMPAVVIVENEESDGAFLASIARAFGRDVIEYAIHEKWLELDHAGGYGEIEKRIERYKSRNTGPERILVVADSDRLFPGHESQTYKKILQACTDNGVPYVLLKKRSIENYLPLGALQRSGRNKQYNAFLHLSNPQKDHYRIKTGFSSDDTGTCQVPSEQMTLYQHVPAKVLDDLCGGFGSESWKLFTTAADVITKDTINLTCPMNLGELPNLLDQIEGLL